MQSKPIVSVLMTAYNRRQYIGEAIDSVLASTLTEFELVIVDDCSSDDTGEIAAAYAKKDSRVKVFKNKKNLGDYPNRNQAASYAQGKYIKYLDSDDIMYPHCLQVMVQAMEKFSDAGYGLASIVDLKRPYPACVDSKETYLEHFFGFGHFDRSPGSSIIKLDAFRQVGGFSGKRMIGDNELWMTLSRYYPLVKFQRDLLWHRSHELQESKSDYAKQYAKLRAEALKEALKHPDCPLTTEEKDKIKKHLSAKKIKQKIKSILYKQYLWTLM